MRALPISLLLAALLVGCPPPPADPVTPAEPAAKRSPEELLAEREKAACAGPIDEPPPPELIGEPAVAEGFVGSVLIQGTVRLSESEVRSTIKTAPGAAVNAALVAADVRALWSTGAFADVSVTTRGAQDDLTVVFTLREQPKIGEVFTDGVDDPPRVERYDRATLQSWSFDRMRKLTDAGHRRARVEVRRRRPEPGVIDLCLLVDKGPRALVKSVDFEQNKAFDDDALRAELGIIVGDVLTDTALAEALFRLQKHYASRGYIKMRVDDPRVAESEDGTALTVVIKVDEGAQYRVGEVKISGPGKYPPLQTQSGSVFNVVAMNADMNAIVQTHKAKGEHGSVTPKTTVDDKAKTVDLDFVVVLVE